MEVAVWDTYVTKKDGNIMHFDIIVPATLDKEELIYSFGREYLKSKGQEGQSLSADQCRFCHIETLQKHWKNALENQGYFILEMENCD